MTLIKKYIYLTSFILLLILSTNNHIVAQNITTYEQAIKQADKQYTAKNYMDAKGYYQMALKYKQNDNYSKKKISEIIDLMSRQMEKEDEYSDIIDNADLYYDQNEYDKAIGYYRDALKIIPNDDYAKGRINKILDMQANEKAKLQNYKQYMANGENLLQQNKFDDAIVAFGFAQKLFPNNNEPPKKVATAKELKADYENRIAQFNKKTSEAGRYLLIKKYSNALKLYLEAQKLFPDNEAVANKIAEITPKAKNQLAYDEKIAIADELYINKNFSAAKVKYQEAANLWTDKSYPTDMILKIDEQLAEQRKDLDKNYTKAIVSADSLIGVEDYESAMAEYNLALSLKPNEQYPKTRVAEISLMIANAAKAKEINDNFKKQVLLGTRLKQQGNLVEARKAFAAAVEFKPSEQMPKDQIIEIDSLLLEREKQAVIDAKYQADIETADSLFGLKNYKAAKLIYQDAASLKPNETEPNLKITKIETILANIEREAQIKKSYSVAISSADDYFSNNRFEEAKVQYQKALTAKPNEKYPKDQIIIINKKLKELAAERAKKFQETVVKADNFFDQAKYQDALLQYKIASGFIPDDQHCQTRIGACNTEIDAMFRKIKGEYDLAVADADKLYASKIFDKAIKGYRKAEKIKPDETYPQEMITKITKFIEDNSVVDVINSQTVINTGETKQFSFEPVRINVRKYNYILVRATNLDGGSAKLLFTYSSKNGKNGGFVINMVEDKSSHDYLIRVGNQYKWFSEDNNSITILPQNGNIEINLVRISKTN